MITIEEITKQGRSNMNMESYCFIKKRTIYLCDEIDNKVAMEIIRQIEYLNDIGSEDITLIINSPGGDVNAGLAIYDVMQKSECDISTVCLGIAASMAAFLLAAGKNGKRFSYKNSEIMIHQVMGGMQGQASDLEITCQRILNKKNLLNTLLANHTKKSVKQIQIDTERDFYMSSDEALEYGIIDHIL